MSTKNFTISLNNGQSSQTVSLILPTTPVPVPNPIPSPVPVPIPVPVPEPIIVPVPVGISKITPNITTVSEGQTVTWSVSSSEISSGFLYYTNKGTTTAKDFADGENSGSIAISSGRGSISKTLTNDQLTENNETIILELRKNSVSGPVVATSDAVVVVDTSKTVAPVDPGISITPSITTVDEGGSVTFSFRRNFTLSTITSTVDYIYEIVGIAGDVTSNDFSSPLTGELFQGTIFASQDTRVITVKADRSTESGLEQFKVVVKSKNRITGNTTELASSLAVTINDTSKDPVSGSRVFTSSTNFTLPVGITSFTVTVSGGGGGGGSYHAGCKQLTGHPGGSGGNGYTSSKTYSVPANLRNTDINLSISVGVGGSGGKYNNNVASARSGIKGSMTTVKSQTTGLSVSVSAEGGGGGVTGGNDKYPFTPKTAVGGDGSGGGAGGDHRTNNPNGSPGADGYARISWEG